MMLPSLLTVLTVAACLAPAFALPIPFCSQQQKCFDFSHSIVSSSTCRPDASCIASVCMTYTNAPGCIKAGDDISHICDSGDANSCLRSDENLFDGSGEQNCGLDGSTVVDKCKDAAQGIQLCQEAEAGETVHFVVKDGNIGKNDVPDTFSEIGEDDCSVSLVCAVASTVGIGNCGNVKAQEEKEMVWSYTIPVNACSCSSTDNPSAASTFPPTLVPSTSNPAPSATPSTQSSAAPSTQPSDVPSAGPSSQPSAAPSSLPSPAPTANPTAQPTAQPSTDSPSAETTSNPTAQPTAQPSTDSPSAKPTSNPTAQPTAQPSTDSPSAETTSSPTSDPTGSPSAFSSSVAPTAVDSLIGSSDYTPAPVSQTAAPTVQPTAVSTNAPTTATPSAEPSTSSPSAIPTATPTTAVDLPTSSPVDLPTSNPTSEPTGTPPVDPPTGFCPTGSKLTTIDFDHDKAGDAFYSHGDYVKDLGYGFRLSVVPGPGGKNIRRPRIYDSNLDNGADPDLQVNMGNLLIIQEKVKPDVPDDNELGGTIIFKFDSPTKIKSIGLVDTDERVVLKFSSSTVGSSRITPELIANGATTKVRVNKDEVDKLKVKFAGSGGISFIKMCVQDDIDG